MDGEVSRAKTKSDFTFQFHVSINYEVSCPITKARIHNRCKGNTCLKLCVSLNLPSIPDS